MAHGGVHLDRQRFCCSICLDLLKGPVTIPCGHSYCIDCIKEHWDKEYHQSNCSCPQCRKSFTLRPDLLKNTMLADLVEDLKKTELQAADYCYAGPGDVACDICQGRKLKATRSCVTCVASYCELHLQLYHKSETFQNHTLVELQHNVCTLHNKVKEVFCRTDQQCICYLCSAEEHRGHSMVSAAAERTERQRQLEVSWRKNQQRIQDGEKDMNLFQQAVEAINLSADKTVEHSDTVFTNLVQLIVKTRSDVNQQIRSQQEAEVSQVKDLHTKLQEELFELRMKGNELEQLSWIEDLSQFLHNYHSLSQLCKSTDRTRINIHPPRYFEKVAAALSQLGEKMQGILFEDWTEISATGTGVDAPLQLAEPKSRAEFLQYSYQITLDPNTAHEWLSLSERNRKVEFDFRGISRGPERFADNQQVLSRESLTGRCYWEVEWSGTTSVAVAYKDISRTGSESLFGDNDKSWALDCKTNEFIHNRMINSLLGQVSSRVGVYLDHSAGVLSFYSVSDTMTLLHRVQTTFTQPLYAGIHLSDYRSIATMCQLK